MPTFFATASPVVRLSPVSMTTVTPCRRSSWIASRAESLIGSATPVFATYLLSAGATRFLIEFIRVNDHVLGPLTIAHIASLVALSAGAYLAYRATGASRWMFSAECRVRLRNLQLLTVTDLERERNAVNGRLALL